MLEKEEKGFATSRGATACSADTVDVIIWIIWRVKLNNPVNFWKVKTTLCNISTKEDTGLSLTELKVGASTFLLLLLTMNIFYRNIDIVKQIWVKFDSITGWHKYHDLLFHIFTEESE